MGLRPWDVGVNGIEIAGIGLHPFGRFPDLTATDMGIAATRDALADAGWATPADARDRSAPRSARRRTAAWPPAIASWARWRGTGIPIYDVEAGCASGGAALAAGRRRHPLRPARLGPGGRASRRCQAASSARRSSRPGRRRPVSARHPRLLRPPGPAAAGRAPASTERRSGPVVVKNRRHGVANPDAMFRQGGDRRGGAGLADDLRRRSPCSCCAHPTRARPRSSSSGRRPRLRWPASRSVHTCRAACSARTPR